MNDIGGEAGLPRAGPESGEDGLSPALRVLRHCDPFGWIARVGLITPSTNTVTAPEWHLMAPPGISIQVARATLFGATSQESYEAMAQSAARAAIDLATAEVDVISFCCTSGTFVCNRREIEGAIARNGGCPANSASSAVIEALRALGVRHVALATPYVDFVHRAELELLREEGFEVVAHSNLGLGRTQAERRAMNRIPHEAVEKMAEGVDHADADAIFLSCAALAAAGRIGRMEKRFGKPVISTNQATFWHTLRLAGYRAPLAGFGRLMEEH